jgi:hypothetical protein
MTTLTFGLISVCSANEHAKVSVSVDGGAVETFDVGIDDIRGPFPQAERQVMLENSLRLAFQGMTKLQARNKIQAGFTVTF